MLAILTTGTALGGTRGEAQPRRSNDLQISEPLLRLGSAMRTTRPTTGLTFAFSQLRTHSSDMVGPRLRLLDDSHPADPFVALDRRKVIPFCEQVWLGRQDLSHVWRHFVQYAGGDLCDLGGAARWERRLRGCPRRLAPACGGSVDLAGLSTGVRLLHAPILCIRLDQGAPTEHWFAIASRCSASVPQQPPRTRNP